MKTFILLFLTMASAYSQDNCGSSDKRNMVDQLDCFCGSGDKSVVQQKIDKLGVLRSEFGKRNENDCHSAIVKTLFSVKDNKISSDVSKKLKSLNYSDEQIDKTLTPVIKRVEAAKLINSGSCSKSSVSISIWPFSYKSSVSEECKAIDKMDPKEREAVMTLAILSTDPFSKGQNSFTPQFKELEDAKTLVESYPENRISKCLGLTKSIEGTVECSTSKADDTKIENCTLLGVGPTNSIKCLQGDIDATGIKACKFLGFGEVNTMKCLDMKPDVRVAELCKFLKFGEVNTINCLNLKPDEEVARGCKLQNFGEVNTLSCLKLKPSKEVAESCKKLNMGEVNAIRCLTISPESSIASACKSLNLGELNTMACLQSGASPEKMHQCGLKNLSELQTLACLKQPLNEKPASALVIDIPRAPKELVDEKSGSTLKANDVSK
ncbi:hypothetical protein DOM21_05510 [Bacteriovorax stolpii]|uniref:Uncharacterized protein n=1 Tax=Bacteriovorax stolpii TaxID=960 RepID=A0A2K9NU89_BACTC|nr:hypothetical protein [Bacteriovorax stolpii]AUN99096.1 hypothetical protein C0V70_13495 [Bacteriovorax stolpii]QDK40922.1 hypothetical protein DOM21_05510 [Bacteriovorax stolpii]TDP55374.1 hypothetical protein C8D79_0422 [Bacteriovorax stolpii]